MAQAAPRPSLGPARRGRGLGAIRLVEVRLSDEAVTDTRTGREKPNLASCAKCEDEEKERTTVMTSGEMKTRLT